ncbi:hypothetical protein R3W88_011848 [Solanum pinnatisectum]|uniref:Transcription factor CBF/NF-Y/archaeal histone domain-containing protein n=1 Tax=Solanum pinnatisectum TaxID=50273 RepID=A0AAV9L7A8_9SOLN|nr:hypothetical protein R3W88_011848 [Solanum pinnatisectum]
MEKGGHGSMLSTTLYDKSIKKNDPENIPNSRRASDKCQKEKRKTINGDDLLSALATLGFEDYIEPLKVYLTRYREMEVHIVLHITEIDLLIFFNSEFSLNICQGSARVGDASVRKDVVGSQLGSNTQFMYEGSFAQGLDYGNSQL